MVVRQKWHEIKEGPGVWKQSDGINTKLNVKDIVSVCIAVSSATFYFLKFSLCLRP